MKAELQTLVARLAALRVLPRGDALVRRALTDDLFFTALTERLAACGMELVEHPYADNVGARGTVRRRSRTGCTQHTASGFGAARAGGRSRIALVQRMGH